MDHVCFSNVWNTREARFEACFLPVVAIIPAVAAAVILLFQALQLLITYRPNWTLPFVLEEVTDFSLDESDIRRRWSPFAPSLIVASVAGCVLQALSSAKSWPALESIAPVMAWFAAIGILITNRPRTAPFSVLTIFIFLAVTQSILLVSHHGTWSSQKHDFGIAVLIISLMSIFIVLLMPLRPPNMPVKDISHPMTTPTATLRSPEDNLTLWQFMTVSWMTPLLSIGHKRQLEDEDVWQLAYEFQHQRLHDNFRQLKGTVIRRLIRANIIDICILTVLGILELVSQYSTPVFLQLLLSSMEDPTAPKRAAVTYATLSMALRLISPQSGVFSLWYGRRCYERARGEMITMLYEKTLGRKVTFSTNKEPGTDSANGSAELHPGNGQAPKPVGLPWWRSLWQKSVKVFTRTKSAPTEKQTASMGKILNLMRNDVYEVAQRFWEVQNLVQKPLSVVFSITLVVRLLGWPSLLAVLALIVAEGVVVILARIRVHFEKKRRIATDSRLQAISQFVEAIRHLRWYGWEGAWLTKVMSARQKELILRIKVTVWSITIAFINTLTLDTSPVIAFFTYTVIAGKPLRVDIAFPGMQLFQMMTMALRDLPDLITVLINAYVAVGRIEDFMAEPEKQDMNTEALIGDSMALENASFAWPGSATSVLHDLNLSFPKRLTVVFGEVASGKTALLEALLGELDMTNGQLMRPHEPIGYCAQTPWLQSMSIKENILFSEPFNEKRYKDVIDACALVQDFEEFKAGDLSLIGENGIGLSGGQRARIALARAVYSSANILLLDDPLSSLDQQTAESIVRKCFAGPLVEGRTVVLVTHRIDLVLHIAGQVIELQHGRASILDTKSDNHLSLERSTSTQSANHTSKTQQDVPEITAAPDKFIEDERRAHGGVKLSVYWEFIKAGKLRWWIVLIFELALYRLLTVAEAWFLKTWGEAYNQQSTSAVLLQDFDIIVPQSSPLDNLPPPYVNIKPWLLGFLILAIAQSVAFVFFHIISTVIVYITAKNMFGTIMERVAGATFRFYDVTPVGRLMNRMTSDIGVIDGNISLQLRAVVWQSITWVSAIVIIASITPTFLVFAILLTTAFVIIFLRFIPTSQSLRRLEMVSLTPLMSNFGALLNGLTTVRAFCVQRQFQERVIRVVDTFQKMDHFYWSLQAWLMYRYDVLSTVSTFLVTMLALATNVSAGLTAFVLLYANKLVQATHGLCRQYGQLQMEFVSVERVIELYHLQQEPKGDVSPPAWWPSFSGDIVFKNVTIKYASHLDPALEGVSFTVKGGSKTAILGRTGSGKSTLSLALLAVVVPAVGQILVDNVDLTEVDRQLLRTRVTFLAQDPVLFPGSMRQNLDPVLEHSDEECDQVLKRVCGRQGWSLDTTVETGGRNLSQGQRQLVGLARAVLRRSAIIILDEATASIDLETAMQIQEIMHEEMKDSTVITIAHRLEAVRNADYRIVLGHGRVLEQGPV